MNVGKTTFYRGHCLWIASILFAMLCCQNIEAQDIGNVDDNANTRQWPSLFKKGTPNRTSEGLETTKGISFPKLGLFRNVGPSEFGEPRPKKFTGFPRLLPERDPDRPGFFQGMNMRSKSFFNRTSSGFSDWASRTHDGARNRTSDRWGNITRSMKHPLGDVGQSQPKSNQPPVRSAQMIAGEPKVKF